MTNLLQRLTGHRDEMRRGLVEIVPTWANMTEQAMGSVRHAYLMNPTVHSVVNARAKVFAEVRFAWRRYRDAGLWTNEQLEMLERPWPGGTATELLTRMLMDVDLSGNAYVYNTGDGMLQILDPSKVQVASNGFQKNGYYYWPNGIGNGRERELQLEEVSHWAPLPHPDKAFVGVSWVEVVATEMRTDNKMLRHQERFYTNAATPNLFVKVEGRLSEESARRLREQLDTRYAGVENAYKTMVMDSNADLRVVGNTFEQMDYTNVQKSTEARIASAGGVPPIIVGLKAGLDASTYSNYGMAMRAFADHTIRPLWNSVCAALGQTILAPRGSELWYDDRHVAALRQDKTDEAKIKQTMASTIRTYIDAGFTPETAVQAVITGDESVLEHTGLAPVQVQPAENAPAAGDGGDEPVPEEPDDE